MKKFALIMMGLYPLGYGYIFELTVRDNIIFPYGVLLLLFPIGIYVLGVYSISLEDRFLINIALGNFVALITFLIGLLQVIILGDVVSNFVGSIIKTYFLSSTIYSTMFYMIFTGSLPSLKFDYIFSFLFIVIIYCLGYLTGWVKEKAMKNTEFYN